MRSFAIQNTEKEKANMTEELKNTGYTIIERFTVGEQGFALGHSDTAPAPYVTWKYRAAGALGYRSRNHIPWQRIRQRYAL